MHSSNGTKVLMQRCGRKMYDDFIERRPGAARDLEILLNSSARHHPVQDHGHDTTSPSRNISVSSTGSSSRQQASGIGFTSRTLPEVYNPVPQFDKRWSTVIDLSPENRWLLTCAKSVKGSIGLAHLNVCRTSSDKELFEKIRATYLKLHGKWKHWLSLKRVQEIRFVQVQSQSMQR